MKADFKRVATTSARIKEAMLLRGKKQADLVRDTGLDKGSISHYVSGKYEPKNEAVYKLAAALDVSEMWLWGYDSAMERPIEQKNSDTIVDVTDRMMKDKAFFSVVEILKEMDEEQLLAVKQMLAVFLK